MKSTPEEREQRLETLYRLLVSLDNIEDCRDLLDDLCTKKELEQMAERILAASLLMQGNSYAQVMEKTDMSSATLSRVSRCVRYGKGYVKMLK